MFSKRHEQDLAEIKSLSLELDRRSRQALEQVRLIKEADAVRAVRRAGRRRRHHEPEERTPESVRGGIGEEIEALAARYELSRTSTDALQGFVRLLDLEQPNFVPKPGTSSEELKRRRPLTAAGHIVASALGESLSGLELEPVRSARRIADIGSGAGFPGMVLAIALPEARVTLIERAGEKCRYLRSVSDELGLENVEVIEGGAQDWSEGAGVCDLVTSRKVGRPKTVLGWAVPLLAPRGAVALYPGRTDFEEDAADDAAEATDGTGLRLGQVHRVESANRHGIRAFKRLYLYVKADEGVADMTPVG